MGNEENTANTANTQAPKQRVNLDGDYPGLQGLSYGIGFGERLLANISEPLLIGCAVRAVIDFVRGGGLTAVPVVTYLGAASRGIAATAGDGGKELLQNPDAVGQP